MAQKLELAKGQAVARASITLASGATVEIEGSTEEISDLVAKLEPPHQSQRARRSGKSPARNTPLRKKTSTGGPQTLIRSLIDEGFFSQKRTINDVRMELQQHGHIYQMHSLSTPLVRLVRARRLRRFKEKDQWVYVQS